MRLPAKALLLGIAFLVLALFTAYTAESQTFAQLSWLLFFVIIALAILTLVDAIVYRVRSMRSS